MPRFPPSPSRQLLKILRIRHIAFLQGSVMRATEQLGLQGATIQGVIQRQQREEEVPQEQGQLAADRRNLSIQYSRYMGNPRRAQPAAGRERARMPGAGDWPASEAAGSAGTQRRLEHLSNPAKPIGIQPRQFNRLTEGLRGLVLAGGVAAVPVVG
ncbi:uncharacterized protein BDR25DRAFT_312607 [Lindgomyces ingoldianus]|uniref:Uncharacterized protein n=1 Tax=Lindgomyces ingoldianus TaxID=673940 RepID=A0ACB6R082_9PLEO|nr:uncharacterized protein BDR25DRAFT_312607 [Lindgomyces ingoldianus]KAF2472683.1 hypothetical protein BDR25DRAFT_312607 [Lindgomyces ingoldianus]